MHIQLINESAYNKHHKLKIHSLCFYYRNHKHVLYGSFTINDEVFIFSFNIFDIYRSYNSKSNKKSSKSHSKTSNSNSNTTQSSSSSKYSNSSKQQSNVASSSSSLASSNNNSKNNLQDQIKHLDKQKSTTTTTTTGTPSTPISINSNTNEGLNDDTLSSANSKSDAGSKKAKFDKNTPLAEALSIVEAEMIPGDFEFNSYMNNLVNSKLNHEFSVESSKNDANSEEDDLVDAKLINEQGVKVTTEIISPSSSNEQTAITNTVPPSIPTVETKLPSYKPTKTANTETPVSSKNLLDNYKNIVNLYENSSKKNIVFDVFTALPQNKNMFLGSQVNSKTFNVNNTSNSNTNTNNNALNLSNFLNVRFEICSNQESTSKSKSKYKKCIKILSVSSKPLNGDSGDIQLKTFEFTEKCLSFRLASIDMSGETTTTRRSNFDVKLINLYEKFLCALINFTTEINEDEPPQRHFKLYRIKHEENLSQTANQKDATKLG
jgi:hypothetical protein